jgi:hypothetical protein
MRFAGQTQELSQSRYFDVLSLRFAHRAAAALLARFSALGWQSASPCAHCLPWRIASALGQLLKACVNGKESDASLFTREDGSAVKDFCKTWQNVRCAAGVGKIVCVTHGTEQCDCTAETRESKYTGRIVHDLRRSAARALRRAGVSENVVMAIGG